MSRNFPDRVRPEKVAAAHRQFAGCVSLQSMPRLADVLADPGASDEVDFEVAFYVDQQGQVVADVAVSGQVPLICQRGLHRFGCAINSRSRLGLIGDIARADELPEDYEPLLYEGEDVALADLVEEELLLAIPLVPVSPESEPVGEASEPEKKEETPTHRPFEMLGKIRNRD
jgi:uncharacterized protein